MSNKEIIIRFIYSEMFITGNYETEVEGIQCVRCVYFKIYVYVNMSDKTKLEWHYMVVELEPYLVSNKT